MERFWLVLVLIWTMGGPSAVFALKCLHCSDVRDNNVTVTEEKMWRDDGRCGPGFLLNNTDIVAQCNPDLGNECCSHDGWCGSSTKHCCQECTKYTRSYGDFDLPVCQLTDVEECTPEEICIEVKIATNTTVRHIDRHVTLRRCGSRDEHPCTKYVNAGHTCVAARQCEDRDLCNGNTAYTCRWGMVLLLGLLLQGLLNVF